MEMKRLIFSLALSLYCSAGFAATPIQPMIDACTTNPCDIVLADGEYDDANPVLIHRDVRISGTRNAVVHSEIQILGGSLAHFVGFTFDMNKAGAPARNGFSSLLYPQNGMIVVMNSLLFADDLEIHAEPGLTGNALLKNAIYVVNGQLQLRAVTQFSRVDWRNSPYQVIELLYNSYANIFDLTPTQQGMNIDGAVSASSIANYGSVIEVAGSKLTLSGANVFNCQGGCVPNTGRDGFYGVSVLRNGFVQVGAGIPTTIQFFTTPAGVNNGITLDPTSTKIVCSNCTVD